MKMTLLMSLAIFFNIVIQKVFTGSVLECPPELPCKCSLTLEDLTKDYFLVVNCSSRNFTSLPTFRFYEGSKVDTILLGDNTFREVPGDAFPSLDIRKVDLSHNKNLSVHRHAFRLIRGSLEKITLENAGFRSMEKFDFLKGLRRLSELLLGYNGGWPVRFPGGVFRDLGLVSLQKLSLKSCGIVSVAREAFRGIEGLTELDMSANCLVAVPRPLERLTNLRELVLDANQIDSLPAGAFRSMQKLRRLRLGLNRIDSVGDIHGDALRGLEASLRFLDLSRNGFERVPKRALQILANLENLDLSGNRIVNLEDGSFNGSYRLRVLDISGNPVKFTKFMFRDVADSLQTLAIRDMELPSLPTEQLKTLRSLRVLDASENAMETIWDDFFLGIRARRLILRSMDIHEVSPGSFLRLRRPVVVDLHGNRLRNLAFASRTPPCTFYALDVSENPIRCDCEVERIVNSGVVERLTGGCRRGDGFSVSDFYDSRLVKLLEDRCGTSRRIFCDWQANLAMATASISTPFVATSLFFLYRLSRSGDEW